LISREVLLALVARPVAEYRPGSRMQTPHLPVIPQDACGITGNGHVQTKMTFLFNLCPNPTFVVADLVSAMLAGTPTCL